MHLLLALLIVFLPGCNREKQKDKPRVIGINQTQNNVYILSHNLAAQIAIKEKISIQIKDLPADLLIPSLLSGQCTAVIADLHPYPHKISQFDFSSPILYIGSILVTRIENKEEKLKGKIIGVQEGSKDERFVQKGNIVRVFNSEVEGLEGLLSGQFDAIILNMQTANRYLKNSPIFRETLTTLMPLLDDKALRLVSLKGKDKKLMKAFEKILKEKEALNELL